jgi:hypothetical protein
MNVRHMLKTYLCCLLLLVLAACKTQPEAPPQVWIDAPTDGQSVPADQQVQITGHAAYEGNIIRIEVWVNEEPHLVQEDPPVQGNLTYFDQMWMPPGDGEYNVKVVAVAADGTESDPDVVHLYVGDAGKSTSTPQPTVTPVSDSTVEPTESVTPTLDVTSTPTPTATLLPSTKAPTPTPTSAPAALIEFSADDTTIDAGKCTKLHWRVEGVQAVFLDGSGVVGISSKKVCPCSDQSYVLSVTHFDGSKEERSITIKVNGSCVTPSPKPTVLPPDNDPPPTPSISSPSGGASLSCGSVNLDWNEVSDPSGITEYRVQVEVESSPSNWDAVSGSPWTGIGGTDLSVNPGCDNTYRWRVRAIDGAGNFGSFSGWAEFSIAP